MRWRCHTKGHKRNRLVSTQHTHNHAKSGRKSLWPQTSRRSLCHKCCVNSEQCLPNTHLGLCWARAMCVHTICQRNIVFLRHHGKLKTFESRQNEKLVGDSWIASNYEANVIKFGSVHRNLFFYIRNFPVLLLLSGLRREVNEWKNFIVFRFYARHTLRFYPAEIVYL